ncbi:MAG TPA: carbon starvation protein A [Anaerolineales bacterium]|nr:carbon starvation protein A [Anaerolineales bacterium]
MNSLVVAALSFFAFILAYRLYGTFISQRLFGVDPGRKTPAHTFEDGVDFVPTRKSILFGHHYTSIAGAGPIVGPAIAVIWGWLPALLWVVFGSIFIGGIHDLGALMVSARHDGRSIGDVTRDIVGSTTRILFLLVILFMLLVVLAVFALVIGILFTMYPASVFPIWIEIPLAIWLGHMIYKRNANVTLWSLIALVLMYITIYIGTRLPLHIPPILGTELTTWVVVLMIYSYIASTLPVQTLLQPRDYINSHELFFGLGVMFVGLLIAHPTIVAPAINLRPEGAPSMLPFLFVIVACGAISGFHSLVSSGTTVKQMDRESDAKLIGYGSMLAEGTLSVIVILASTAGFASLEKWNAHYINWTAAQGLGAKIGAFVEGGASFLSALGIGHSLGAALIAVVVISFAATTLDTATRIQRYVIVELARASGIPWLRRRHPATLVAVGTALLLALAKGGGKGGMILWPLFGTTNQLLAGLALLVISLYLVKQGKPGIFALLPMLFVLGMTGWAMVINLRNFVSEGTWLLAAIGGIVMVLNLWIVVEAIRAFASYRRAGT